jgi:predicted DNA-binding transcriptional regulator AlpA
MGGVPKEMTERYLSVTDVAARLGITTAAVAVANLPEPDAMIGKARGWRPETIDAWRRERPGKGNWGPRPKPSP